MPRFLTAALCMIAIAAAPVAAAEWRGIPVAPENRCSEYNKKRDYVYPQSVEARIVADMGGRVYGPYTGRTFRHRGETDIEHIVATSEAHDSGLCAADATTRRAFARDILNLTLAAPAVNRCGAGGKCAGDAAEWLPVRNRCWFAARVVDVRRKWGLTIDRREAIALEAVLSGCASSDVVIHEDVADASLAAATIDVVENTIDPLRLWDDNGNGRITCAEARRHGIAPVPRRHPAYVFMRDGDGDGVVCE